MNRNYVRGRAFEYRTMERYRKEGWIVARTAGPHGFFDIIAIRYPEIRLIQCKYSKMDLKAQLTLMSQMDKQAKPSYYFLKNFVEAKA